MTVTLFFSINFTARSVQSAPQSKATAEPVKVAAPIETVMVEDLLLPPGRYGRPTNIVVIIRGLPGSGKSYLARLIKVRQRSFQLFGIECILSAYMQGILVLVYNSYGIHYHLGKGSVARWISAEDTIYR